jgi:ring-1,2-phenylacetyl-CoA epoxidase subunit PaaE
MTGSVRQRFHALTVARVDRLCADAVAVTFAVPPELAGSYAFRAGQSLTLRRVLGAGEERRSYSVCAPEGAPPRIGVREIPGGLMSSWLVREVRPGDAIEVAGPTGSFTPDVGAAGRHVLLAAGSGITPVLSIVATVLRNPATTVTVVYGNRRADTVMFVDELADLKDRYPSRLELIHLLSREARETELFTGRIDTGKLEALRPLLPDDADHWWLCGPYGMVANATGFLQRRGVRADRIHQELFFVEDTPPPQVQREDTSVAGATSEVTVRLDGRSTTTTVSRQTSVLEGAQRVRPDLPFACKGGVCGTCRAKVTHGRVHMRRNFALEQSEVDEGFVLTCQSLPRSDEVVVDYDA